MFNVPNEITDAAWKGWVQERGLYFLGERDPRYRDLVALEDPFPYNKGEKRGALVATPVRQRALGLRGTGPVAELPAGVDGAYQLLANLISLGTAIEHTRSDISDCRLQIADFRLQKFRLQVSNLKSCQLKSAIQSAICNLKSAISWTSSILVVGAGPAGATAARTLARAGVTVRLLDRSNFPRNKPCGGGISLRVLKRFPYLERELGRIATHRVARLHLEGPCGESTIIDADEPAALMIRRVEFDELLVSLAVEAGAELVAGAEIVQASSTDAEVDVVARDGRHFKAPIVIAADGVHSVVARRLGINSGWPASSVALDMMEETSREVLRDRDPSTLWVAYGHDPASNGRGAASHGGPRRAPEGYAYMFPKRDHVNVGIGYVLAHYRDSIGTAPYELQRGLVDHLRAPGGDRRGIGAAQLHACVHPGRGTASASRPGARPAGR